MVPSKQRRQSPRRQTVISAAATQTLLLWFLFAGVIFILVYHSNLLDENTIPLRSLSEMSITDFHQRRGLLLQENNIQGYTLSRASSVAMMGTLKLEPNVTIDSMSPQKQKVLEKIRRRKIHQDNKTHNRTFDFSPKDFSSYPILPTTRILPDMTTKKGGVIIFLHVPKTGGQTIRYNFGSPQLSRAARQRVMNEMQGNQSDALDMDLLMLPTLLFLLILTPSWLSRTRWVT